MVDELSGKVVKSLGLPDVGLSLDRIYGGTITPDRRWLVGGIPGMFKLA